MKGPARQDTGFALAALIIFLTALSIAMAAAVPAYRIQAQRELEAELIFRGEEYVRAIQKYQRQFGIYPPSIDALLETNGLRYLRRAYKDPITGEDFRLLTANPDGTINGSTLYQQQGSGVPLFQGGTPQMFGAPGLGQAGPNAQEGAPGRGGRGNGAQEPGGFEGGSPQSGFGGQTGGFPTGFPQAAAPNAAGFGSPGSFGQQGGSRGQTGGISTGFGQAISPNSPSGLGGAGGFGQQAGGGRGGGFGPQGTGPRGGGSNRGISSQAGFPQQSSAQPGQGVQEGRGTATPSPQPFGNGGVVGVAPTNEGGSLKVYNQRERYSEWEFIAIPGFGAVPAVSSPGQVPGQPSPFQDIQTSPSGSGQTNPFN